MNKFARKRESTLVKLTKQEQLNMKYISNSDDYYVTKEAKVYHKYKPNYFYEIKPYVMHKGYYIVVINNKSLQKTTRRLHRIVAEAFIDNPSHLPVVGHKDNNKLNCNVNILYWTTYAENTKKAVMDGLLVNAKGFEDSQSFPVIAYDCTGKEIGIYGSVTECSKQLGVSKSTILRHCRDEVKSKPRQKYTFKFYYN